MATQNSPQSLIARLGTGIFKGMLLQKQREYEQQQLTQRHEQNLGYLTKQDELSRARTGESRTYEEGQAKTKREQALADAERNFNKSILTYAAEQGSLDQVDPSLIDEILGSGDIDPRIRGVLENVSKTAAKRYEDKMSIEKQKAAGKDKFKPTDLSALAGDLKAIGYGNLTPDAYRAIAQEMDRSGLPANYALARVFPDPNTIPRAEASGDDIAKKDAEILRSITQTHAPRLAEMQKQGIDVNNVIRRMRPKEMGGDGENFDDALRHETADRFIESLNLNPETPVDMSRVNEALRKRELSAIPGAEGQLPLSSLIDEMLARNVGKQGKSDQGTVLWAILSEALNLVPPKQGGGGERAGFNAPSVPGGYTPTARPGTATPQFEGFFGSKPGDIPGR